MLFRPRPYPPFQTHRDAAIALLQAAAAYITDERRYALEGTEYLAVDAEGRHCDVTAGNVARFTIEGALLRARRVVDVDWEAYDVAHRALCEARGLGVAQVRIPWTTHTRALEMFEEAKRIIESGRTRVWG